MSCYSCPKNYVPMQPEKQCRKTAAVKPNAAERIYPNKPGNINGTYPVPAMPVKQANPAPVMPPIAHPVMNMSGYCPPASTYSPPPEEIPEMIDGYMYTPGYLRSNIGNLVRVEFLIGDAVTDRVGVLCEVGANYIVLDSPDYYSKMMCDLYSIKFVTVLKSSQSKAMFGSYSKV